MLTAEELRLLPVQIREGSRPVDDELVTRIEQDVSRYRGFLSQPRPQLPPAELTERLPLMGWLIYEASLKPLWTIPPGFTTLSGAAGDAARAQVALIWRLADAGRRLPWPEFAPRALGAIRVAALVESKGDTENGYAAAWTLHDEARRKYESYRDSLCTGDRRSRFVRDLDEVLLPLALAETGTACRAAERVICCWADELDSADPPWTERDSAQWTERMFRELSQGAAVGELALRTAAGIEERFGLAQRVDEHRLSLVISYRNPAIMTCRALLLLYSMCPEMAELGRLPEHGTWTDFRAKLTERFDAAFEYLRRRVTDERGEPIPLDPDHRRSMVQLCLHLALLTPGHELSADLPVDGGLTLRSLDDDAVTAMSQWLATEVDGKQRGDANTIGSAAKPSFIASVEACRRDAGAASDYRAWRSQWPQLDRYADRPGRRERIGRILAATPGDAAAG